MDSLKDILSQIEGSKKELKKHLPLSDKDDRRLWEKFRLEWNYNSNHIEGNTLTYGETKLLLIFDKTNGGNHTLREYEEMKAHDVTVKMVRDWADEERMISETDIRNLNKIILVRNFWKNAITPDGGNTRREIHVGEYKIHPNSVRLANGEIFHYAEPEEVPLKMGELMDWYRNDAPSLHPIEVAALFHHKLVLIHPFDDGNGRVCRLLLNYHLLKNNLPPVIIPSVDKKNYLDALNQADVGNTDAFVAYIGKLLLRSLEWNLIAAKGESLEEPDDFEKELAVLKKSLKNEDILQEIKSTEVLDKAVKENVIPSIELLKEKMNQFHELFFNTDFYILISNSPKGARTVLNEIENDIKLELGYHSVLREMYSIILQYQLQGFKYSRNPFDLSIEMNWVFEEYNYFFKMKLGQKEFKETKLYVESFTSEELKDIVGKIGSYFISEIKKRKE